MKAMKSTLVWTCLLSALLAGAGMCEERTFKSSDGKELVAEIVKATAADVTVKRKNDGKEFTLPLARLSKEDQEFVTAWLAKKEASEKLNTRAEREMEVSQRDGKKTMLKIPKGEFLSADGVLTLYPGDKVHLEFEKQGEKLANPTLVAEVTHPERTITFEMSHKEGTAILMRTTEIQQTVALDCTHCAIGSDEFARTNLIPTEKGLASFDSWPGTVWIVRLSNLEVSDRPAMEVYQEKVGK